MALTPWEQHQWYLLTKSIQDTGGLVNPIEEDRNTVLWWYLLSAALFTIGVVATAIGLFAPSPPILVLGLLTTVVGAWRFRQAFETEKLLFTGVPIHKP